ncbi:MAG: winged helix-turn-helix transcriptional regulator [Phormidesmis sp. RL_2_1]|nr:winged helix-turn-helix transcriptional regulator [Phormidesmis sp. RL_2_1]
MPKTSELSSELPRELPLLLDLRPELAMPLHRQIYEQIRAAILTGKVRSHQKLPASRQLAQVLMISRTTVVQSYDQLISEGYLLTRPGAGTFVCAQLPDNLIQSDITPLNAQSAFAPGTGNTTSSQPVDLSTYGEHLSPSADDAYALDCPLSFSLWPAGSIIISAAAVATTFKPPFKG